MSSLKREKLQPSKPLSFLLNIFRRPKVNEDAFCRVCFHVVKIVKVKEVEGGKV